MCVDKQRSAFSVPLSITRPHGGTSGRVLQRLIDIEIRQLTNQQQVCSLHIKQDKKKEYDIDSEEQSQLDELVTNATNRLWLETASDVRVGVIPICCTCERDHAAACDRHPSENKLQQLPGLLFLCVWLSSRRAQEAACHSDSSSSSLQMFCKAGLRAIVFRSDSRGMEEPHLQAAAS
ncbi:unnamed protein product [Pleuronectes platessa]|uniref:Uncharacterized protein n=1 Tax=Pleuronectes platessa TaxID=8262 RepID=A0A9N7Z5L8_PLEPL|nr:unnamed protein product [Pleuronectes platessa]